MPSPTPSSDTPSRSARKRRAILDAAMAEFAKRGFAGTNMDQLASNAEVSKRTVYNHFPSKDVLFDAILDELYARCLVPAVVPYDPQRPLREQLIQLLALKLKRLSDPSFLSISRVAIVEVITSPDRARTILARMKEGEDGLEHWLRAANKDGRLQLPDLEFAVNQIEGMLNGFALWPQLILGAPPLTKRKQTQVLETTADMFLNFHAQSARHSGRP